MGTHASLPAWEKVAAVGLQVSIAGQPDERHVRRQVGWEVALCQRNMPV